MQVADWCWFSLLSSDISLAFVDFFYLFIFFNLFFVKLIPRLLTHDCLVPEGKNPSSVLQLKASSFHDFKINPC